MTQNYFLGELPFISASDVIRQVTLQLHSIKEESNRISDANFLRYEVNSNSAIKQLKLDNSVIIHCYSQFSFDSVLFNNCVKFIICDPGPGEGFIHHLKAG